MYITDENAGMLLDRIREMDLQDDEQLFIAVGEKTWGRTEDQIASLPAAVQNFFGGVFPGIVVGGRKYEKGVLIIRLPMLNAPKVIRDISGGDCDMAPVRDRDNSDAQSVFVFVDGLSGRIGTFLQSLCGCFGDQTLFAGGGAGSMSLKQMPCVFSQDGIFQDAAVVATVDRESFQGVRHGWNTLEGPFIANQTDGNVLIEFNWKDALSFYCEIVERDSNEVINAENFYGLAMRYPFGMHTDGMEDVIRDPLLVTEKGHLMCCGDIPGNTVVSVFKGERENLIKAAETAAQDCVDQTAGRHVTHALVIDCISRTYFLGDYFERELDVISSKLTVAKGAPEPAGVLTLGEIASYGSGAIELFNKTTVLTVVTE